WRYGDSERYTVACESPDGDDNVTGRRAGRDGHDDAGGRPCRRRCRRPIERDSARALRGAEVRAADRDRGPDRSTRWREPCHAWRYGDSERYTVAGEAPDGDDDVARRCACGHRYGDAGRRPCRRRRRRPIERDGARALRGAEVRAADRDRGPDRSTRWREARDGRRYGDSERYTVAGESPDGDDDVARRCASGPR